MACNVHAISGWIQTPLAMMKRAISQKDTRGGSKIQFMSVIWAKIREALTPEDSKERIIWGFIEKILKRRFVGVITRWKTVD